MKKIIGYILVIISAFLLCSCSEKTGESAIDPPESVPKPTVVGEATVPVTFLVAANKDDHYFLLNYDKVGKLLWYDEKKGDTSSNDGYRTTYFPSEEGDFRYYMEKVSQRENDYAQSKAVVFNGTGTKEVMYDLNSMEFPLDLHDAVFFSDKHYIVSTSVSENTPDRGMQMTTYIQEIKDGEKIWEFTNLDYPFLYDTRITDRDVMKAETESFNDLMHVNSLNIDPADGNLLVSSRNQCAVYKIDRTDGSIIWTFGGEMDEFGLSEKDSFHFQHSASITDEGNLLLYDNGYNDEDSRILEFKLNEAEKSYELVNELVLPYHTWNYGSVEELSADTYLVQRGNTGISAEDPSFYEIDKSSGEIYFSLTFEKGVECYWASFTDKTW